MMRRRMVRPPTEPTTVPAITGVLGWLPPLGGGLAASMIGSVPLPLPVVVLVPATVDPVLLVSDRVAFVMGTIGRVGDVPSGGGAVGRPSAFAWSVGGELGGVLALGITGLGMLLFGPSWSVSGGFAEADSTPIPGLFVGADAAAGGGGGAGSTEGAAGGGGAGGGVGGAGAGGAAACGSAGGGGGGAGDGTTGRATTVGPGVNPC